MTSTGPAPLGSSATTRERIVQAVLNSDYLRRSPFNVGGDGFHKEWLHFVIHAPQAEVLINFSLVDDVRSEASPGTEFPRIVVLAREPGSDGGWDGDIELFDPEDTYVRGGGIEMRYGPNSVRFENGRYLLRVKLRNRPIAMNLQLEPLVFPALSNNIRLELEHRPINWMALPRLAASGTLRLGERVHRFHGVPAYHDHNWGHFLWGTDFAWEWGFALPEDTQHPWSVVFVRLLDRGHTRALTQGLFLWRREAHWRIFRGHELQVAPQGLLRVDRPYKLPPVMHLISPGSCSDIPQTLEARASADGDWATLRFHSEDVAQVCIPNDSDDEAVTVINEVSGRLHLEGEVRGERLRMQGRAMFEFVRGG